MKVDSLELPAIKKKQIRFNSIIPEINITDAETEVKPEMIEPSVSARATSETTASCQST
jgi:hypothetical protein